MDRYSDDLSVRTKEVKVMPKSIAAGALIISAPPKCVCFGGIRHLSGHFLGGAPKNIVKKKLNTEISQVPQIHLSIFTMKLTLVKPNLGLDRGRYGASFAVSPEQ